MTFSRQLLAGIILITFSVHYATADTIKLSNVDFASINESINTESVDGKVVYVDFWAAWCKPCLKSFPWMAEMQEKYAENGLKIIAVNLDKEAGFSTNFLEKAPANFDVVFDTKATLAELFKVKAMPSSYLFDREGNLAASHLGFQEKNKALYEKELRMLLGLE